MAGTRNPMLSTLTALVLSFALAACGGATQEGSAETESGKLGGEASQPEQPEESEQHPEPAPHEMEWGSVLFDNSDEAFYDLSYLGDSDNDKQFVVNDSPYSNKGARFERLIYCQDTGCVVYVYRFDGSSWTSEDAVLSLADDTTGVDILLKHVLGNGSEIYFVTSTFEEGQILDIYEVEDDGLVLTNIIIDNLSEDSLLDAIDRISFEDGLELSDLNTSYDVEYVGAIQRIGSDLCGYMSVPSNWTEYADEEDAVPGSIRYSDGASCAVQMAGLERSDEDRAMTGEEQALEIANAYVEQLQDNEQVTDMSGVVQTLQCGLTAHVCVSSLDTGVTMYSFFFGDDERIYVIDIVGDGESALEMASYVVSTFEPTE